MYIIIQHPRVWNTTAISGFNTEIAITIIPMPKFEAWRNEKNIIHLDGYLGVKAKLTLVQRIPIFSFIKPSYYFYQNMYLF